MCRRRRRRRRGRQRRRRGRRGRRMPPRRRRRRRWRRRRSGGGGQGGGGKAAADGSRVAAEGAAGEATAAAPLAPLDSDHTKVVLGFGKARKGVAGSGGGGVKRPLGVFKVAAAAEEEEEEEKGGGCAGGRRRRRRRWRRRRVEWHDDGRSDQLGRSATSRQASAVSCRSYPRPCRRRAIGATTGATTGVGMRSGRGRPAVPPPAAPRRRPWRRRARVAARPGDTGRSRPTTTAAAAAAAAARVCATDGPGPAARVLCERGAPAPAPAVVVPSWGPRRESIRERGGASYRCRVLRLYLFGGARGGGPSRRWHGVWARFRRRVAPAPSRGAARPPPRAAVCGVERCLVIGRVGGRGVSRVRRRPDIFIYTQIHSLHDSDRAPTGRLRTPTAHTHPRPAPHSHSTTSPRHTPPDCTPPRDMEIAAAHHLQQMMTRAGESVCREGPTAENMAPVHVAWSGSPRADAAGAHHDHARPALWCAEGRRRRRMRARAKVWERALPLLANAHARRPPHSRHAPHTRARTHTHTQISHISRRRRRRRRRPSTSHAIPLLTPSARARGGGPRADAPRARVVCGPSRAAFRSAPPTRRPPSGP